MALLYSPSTQGLMANAIKNSFRPSTAAANVAVSLYTGAQPSPATILSNWSQYRAASTNCLWIGTGFAYSLTGNTVYASTIGPGTTPLRDGTATWAILWIYVVAANSLPFSSTTIDPAYQRFIVVPVSDLAGNGVVKLNSTTLTVAGGPMQVASVSLTLS